MPLLTAVMDMELWKAAAATGSTEEAKRVAEGTHLMRRKKEARRGPFSRYARGRVATELRFDLLLFVMLYVATVWPKTPMKSRKVASPSAAAHQKTN